jgi:hypothetical protein
VKRLAILMAAAAVLALGCAKETPTDSTSSPVSPDAAAIDSGTDAASVSSGSHREVTYEIVVKNLTPATGMGSSQPLSPPVIATHRHNVHMFRLGAFASGELAQIAQDAVNGPMIDKLSASPAVCDVATGTAPILPGAENHFHIQRGPGCEFLSMAFMLVNTNDGFSGLDDVKLPGHGKAVYYVRAFDAGSEKNTELKSDIPGPCCGSTLVGTPTHQRIHFHRGIRGSGDLDPVVYGWHGPVAKITIERVQ